MAKRKQPAPVAGITVAPSARTGGQPGASRVGISWRRSPCVRRSRLPIRLPTVEKRLSETSEPWSLIDERPERPAIHQPDEIGERHRSHLVRGLRARRHRAVLRRAGCTSSTRRSRGCDRRAWSAASRARRAGCCGWSRARASPSSGGALTPAAQTKQVGLDRARPIGDDRMRPRLGHRASRQRR